MHSIGTPPLWAAFVALVLFFLALDLGLFHRKDVPISTRNALAWTAVWITMSLAFNALVAVGFEIGRAHV
jgi:tellurite resistance protein TerC